MYSRKNHSHKDMVYWTRTVLYKFIVIAIIPVIVYNLLYSKWLHLHLLPIALIGTAVAFIVGFKNNASYGRLWEARQIWGGIVNASRTFCYVESFLCMDLYFAPTLWNYEFDKIGSTLLGQLEGMAYGTMKISYEFIAQNFFWTSIPFSVLIYRVFYTMERIGEVRENPFEGTAIYVPITTKARDIEIDLHEMPGEPKAIIPI